MFMSNNIQEKMSNISLVSFLFKERIWRWENLLCNLQPYGAMTLNWPWTQIQTRVALQPGKPYSV